MGQSFNTHHAVVLIALAGWYKFYFRNRTTLTSSDADRVPGSVLRVGAARWAQNHPAVLLQLHKLAERARWSGAVDGRAENDGPQGCLSSTFMRERKSSRWMRFEPSIISKEWAVFTFRPANLTAQRPNATC